MSPVVSIQPWKLDELSISIRNSELNMKQLPPQVVSMSQLPVPVAQVSARCQSPSCLQCQDGDYDPVLGLLRVWRLFRRWKFCSSFSPTGVSNPLELWFRNFEASCLDFHFLWCASQAKLCGVAVLCRSQDARVPCVCALSAYSGFEPVPMEWRFTIFCFFFCFLQLPFLSSSP